MVPTNLDLHYDPHLLDDCDLFVSCGHDEYWSKQMRDSVENFGRSGGNVLFLSGNTCCRGEAEGIIGYEADAGVYNCRGEPTHPTPSDFLTLATADLPEWDDWLGRTATMGLFRRDGKGTVLAAATTGWGRGLLVDRGPVHQITRNIVGKLRGRVT